MQPWKDITPENKKVIFGMTSFIVTHTILSHPLIRNKIISSISLKTFSALYVAVTLFTLGPAGYYYLRYTKGTGEVVPWIAVLFISLSLSLSLSYLQ